MKILYAIQGTGNGHITRARDIVPALQEKNEVHVLISGLQADVALDIPVTYRFRGLGFIFGKTGGVDILDTYKKNKLKTFFAEINTLPVHEYDLVISDFEPVSAWACYLNNKQCISLSHQAAVLNKHAPKPGKTDPVGKGFLKRYAPATTKYGFHFKPYDEHIFTPVIRKQVREQVIENKGYYTVYLPSYDDKRILKVLREFPEVEWQVFSKHNKSAYIEDNICIFPVNNDAFISSMAGAAGILCGAGFETPAEALFMKKKLLVVPMKNQYEQQCNAAALDEMGVEVIKSFKLKHKEKISNWIENGVTVEVDYPDVTGDIINKVLTDFIEKEIETIISNKPVIRSFKRFRHVVLKKLIA